MALKMKLHAHYVFTKMLILSFKMHEYILMLPCNTLIKCTPFAKKASITCVHTSVSDKNQSSFQTKGFMYGLVPKILETCERVANKI